MLKNAVLLVSFTIALAGCGNGKSDFEQEYRNGFVESCKKSAVASGAPAELTDAVCECSADTVMKDYTSVERAQLRGDAVDAILDKCIKEAGADLG